MKGDRNLREKGRLSDRSLKRGDTEADRKRITGIQPKTETERNRV